MHEHISSYPRQIKAQLCIVGSGAAGLSAALTGACLGLDVVLIEHAPYLGGQASNALIGTFCGFYSNAPGCVMLTKGIAQEMMDDLRQMGGLYDREADNTIVPIYDNVIFTRWAERKVAEAGITSLLECTVYDVERSGRRISSIKCCSRFGLLDVFADFFIDASGDAVLARLAGLPCTPIEGIRGSVMFSLEGVDYSHPHPTIEELNQTLETYAAQYGLVRKKGLIFYVPERNDLAICNLTHVPTKPDPFSYSKTSIEGKDQADSVLRLLHDVFPATFGRARIRAYGLLGMRQTFRIKGMHCLTLDELRAGHKFPDSIGMTAWPVELHMDDEYLMEPFPSNHVHYIPLSSMVSSELDNYIAAGRCIDAEDAALASVRVMGPCMAMGMAAANAAELTMGGDIHRIDISALQSRIKFNLE